MGNDGKLFMNIYDLKIIPLRSYWGSLISHTFVYKFGDMKIWY